MMQILRETRLYLFAKHVQGVVPEEQLQIRLPIWLGGAWGD